MNPGNIEAAANHKPRQRPSIEVQIKQCLARSGRDTGYCVAECDWRDRCKAMAEQEAA